jgi:hypothetical protein
MLRLRYCTVPRSDHNHSRALSNHSRNGRDHVAPLCPNKIPCCIKYTYHLVPFCDMACNANWIVVYLATPPSSPSVSAAQAIASQQQPSVFPSLTKPDHSSLHPSIFSLTPGERSMRRIQRISLSSSSATKYEESRERMDSNVAVGAARRSGRSRARASQRGAQNLAGQCGWQRLRGTGHE